MSIITLLCPTGVKRFAETWSRGSGHRSASKEDKQKKRGAGWLPSF